MTKPPTVVNHIVEIVNDQDLIIDAVKIMVEKKVSSVLVKDQNENIVGIFTERDIVRKFTLLEMADKLERKVSTIMSRPVLFVHAQNLDSEITKMHLQHKFRHFPVLNSNDAKVDNLVGIVSITDFLRPFIEGMGKPEAGKAKAGTAKQRVKLAIIGLAAQQNQAHVQAFQKAGVDAFVVDNVAAFMNKEASSQHPPAVLWDMDGYNEKDLKNLILICKKYRGPLIMTTSNPTYLPVFSRHLHAERQMISLKPLDHVYCHWLLTTHWIS